MINLSEILDPGAMELSLRSTGKAGVLQELAGLPVRSGKIGDPAPLYARLLEREALGSTGIGEGIAIPHCTAEGLTGPLLAFGRKSAGIPFDAVDGMPVSFFFLIVVPIGQQALHLQLLSRLARILRDGRLKEVLSSASQPEEILARLRELEAE